MTTELVLFAENATALTYSDKKGNLKTMTPEGSMFSTNKELTSGKQDLATFSAYAKASNGRYAAAVDIFAVTFPAATKHLADLARAKKFSFLCQCEVIAALTPKEGKGWTDKQLKARSLATACLKLEQQREAARVEREAERSQITDDVVAA